MIKLYLDNCALQRPLDDKIQTRVRLEAEAVLGILEMCKAGKIELISSEVLKFEVAKNSMTTRRDYADSALAFAVKSVQINDSIERRASELVSHGIKPIDALHLASAEEAEADYFCTCDNLLLKRARISKKLKAKIVTPLELIEELDL